MLTTKNQREGGKATGIISASLGFALLALAALLAGCGPAGTHALLKGRNLLERGDYAGAEEEFKEATSLLATNAEAWNYLGVAEQHNGQFGDAAKAYQRALELDRDLSEAHYNLGCLWLEQDKPDDAANEFTAYTLRRVNEPNGWLKLGLAQLRMQNVLPAEKSFSTALYLSPNNPEALNGLGLARMQRNRPEEAEKFFQAAVQSHPDYAPAILNLATVAHDYLHDDRLALAEYRAYLAFQPQPADWNQVNAIVSNMEQNTAQAAPPPPENRTSAPPQNLSYAEQKREEQKREEQQQQEARLQQERQAREARTRNDKSPSGAQNEYAPPRQQTETEQVAPETRIVTAPNTLQPVKEPPMFASVASNPPPENSSHGQGFFHWFHGQPAPDQTKVTPLPSENSQPLPPAKPVHIVQPAPPSFSRYLYLSPPKPPPGERRAASAVFARGRTFEREGDYTDALDSYRRAAHLDPAWFEAQYNCGVMAYRLRDYSLSLISYEMALAIEPDSTNARYNFALALKASGYVPDAVNELRKVLALKPNDVAAHLELGNLYAQQLFDVPRAREEYMRVLQLDPTNPQASNIEFWLSANPQ